VDPDTGLENLPLDRPLVIFDLETTGLDPKVDRIVEFSFLKLRPDGSREHVTFRVNPGMPISPEATAKHGITDADVAELPQFNEYAQRIVRFLKDCDLCGFNIRSYDLKLLVAELARCNILLELAGRRLIDAKSIYHNREPRSLEAAVRFYCNRDHIGAHGAAADVLATLDVLESQLDRYDLPRNIAELHELFAPPGSMDLEGKFRKKEDGEVYFTFGKYKDQKLAAVRRDKPDYLEWMLGQDFFDDTKAVIRMALERK
jgi:DNA polymerase-3 subunit epsilon